MEAELKDCKKVFGLVPSGISGHLLDRHHTDQVRPCMAGEKRYQWFSDGMIESHAVTRLVLSSEETFTGTKPETDPLDSQRLSRTMKIPTNPSLTKRMIS